MKNNTEMDSMVDILNALDGEQKYQDKLRPGHEKSVGDYLTLLDSYLRQAQDEWANDARPTMALAQVRKIAVAAIRCMEKHGVVTREKEANLRFAAQPCES